MNQSPHWLPRTPDEALGPTVRESITVEGRTFVITRPDAVDRQVEHAGMPAVDVPDEYLAYLEYMPVWAHLWPAARRLGSIVLREPWGQDLEVLEIGCGLGLAGMAALARGLRVIFSDYDATALRFAADNARINGFAGFRLLHMDWRWPPEGLQVPVIIGSDLVYQGRFVEPLAGMIRRVLVPGGIALILEQDRSLLDEMELAFRSERLACTRQDICDNDTPERPFSGVLFRLRHFH